jgi:hypothetical protein
MEQRGPRGRVQAGWAAAALAVIVVLPLGLLIGMDWEPVIEADVAVSDDLVVSGRGSDVDILRFLTGAGGAAVRVLVLAPVAGWLAWQRKWRLVVLVAAGGALIGGLNELLKSVFDRPRPSYNGPIEADGYSYPSGHASGAAATATVLVLVYWPVVSHAWRWVLVALAVTVVAVVGYARRALRLRRDRRLVCRRRLGAAARRRAPRLAGPAWCSARETGRAAVGSGR